MSKEPTQAELMKAAEARGWVLGESGWYHPEHDDRENDPPFPSLEALDAYAHLMEPYNQ